MPELGGEGGGGQLTGGGGDGGGGGGERYWPQGLSQAEHIVHSIWYFAPAEIRRSATGRDENPGGKLRRTAAREMKILREMAVSIVGKRENRDLSWLFFREIEEEVE